MKIYITLLLTFLLCFFLFSCNDGSVNGGAESQGEENQDEESQGEESQDEESQGEENQDEGNEENVPSKEDTVVLNEITSPVSLAKPITTSYLLAARSTYKTAAYADYTTSIIKNYTTAASDHNDKPLSVTLSFTGVENAFSYILELSLSSDFTTGVRRFFLNASATSATVTNLYTGCVYYWRVTAVITGSESVCSEISSFETAENEVRWISVDGVHNVRDLGGWNGLNQGMVYRGSELNLVGNHGLDITEAGARVMREELGIKTDLDLRAAAENGSAVSPIGAGVAWVSRPIGSFLSAFGEEYRLALSEFAKPSNYPIYMHCWGGADRTGTLALMLEGICGVSEEDLSIDLEMTSFSSFGYRYRYDNDAYLYASTVEKIKADYAGETLSDKFIAYALDIGLTRAEISNIQSLLTGSGAAFGEDSLGNLFFDPKGDAVSLSLITLNGQAVTAVLVAGKSIPFDIQNGVLTLAASAPASCGAEEGTLTVILSDGTVLLTDFTTTPELTLGEKIANGDIELLFNDSVATYENGAVKKASGSLRFTHSALLALYEEGCTAITFRVSANLTGTVNDTDLRIRLLARWHNGSSYISNSDKQDLTANKAPTTVEGTLTVHLTEEFLGSANYFILTPQSGCDLVVHDIAFLK